MKPAYKILIAILALPGLMLMPVLRSLAYDFPGISTPIAIIRNDDMRFGNILIPTRRPGAIILSPTTIFATGGINFSNINGTIETACLTLRGEPGYIFAVTLPNSATISDDNGHSLPVDDFISSPAVNGILNYSPSGTEIRIGATVHIAAGQSSGVYTNAPEVAITINYN